MRSTRASVQKRRHVAVAAKQLQSLVGHATHQFAGVQLQGRGGLWAEIAALVGVYAGI